MWAEPSRVLIVGFEPTNEGVVIKLNIPSKLKTGNISATEFWVSWDKIGDALFSDYCQLTDDVDSIREIRKNYFDSKEGAQNE
jgi:tyrosyl-tRNA synthetase